MKLHIIALCSLSVLISACTSKREPELDPSNADYIPELSQYAHIENKGNYVMLSDSLNIFGQGEEVTISPDYYIAKFAVTNNDWQRFITATNHLAPDYWINGKYPDGKNKHPVVWVSYNDALAYCDWLNTLYPEFVFRLPSQGEWEYAAVGYARTSYPWGNNADAKYNGKEIISKFNFNAVFGAYLLQDPDKVATYTNTKSTRYGEQEAVKNIFSIGENCQLTGWINHQNYTGLVYTDAFQEVNATGGFTCEVDSYPEGVSTFGCYNMSGNCWEWTSTEITATNGAEKGQLVNAIKGGSWYATASSCKVSFRGEGRRPSGRYATVGIRVVAEKRK